MVSVSSIILVNVPDSVTALEIAVEIGSCGGCPKQPVVVMLRDTAQRVGQAVAESEIQGAEFVIGAGDAG